MVLFCVGDNLLVLFLLGHGQRNNFKEKEKEFAPNFFSCIKIAGRSSFFFLLNTSSVVTLESAGNDGLSGRRVPAEAKRKGTRSSVSKVG